MIFLKLYLGLLKKNEESLFDLTFKGYSKLKIYPSNSEYYFMTIRNNKRIKINTQNISNYQYG